MAYYDLNRPFSIDDWNQLIRDVNDILQNPDDGCDPIDPLDEVSDPHRWSVDDIQAVRDKLIETCPDISFSEELRLWAPGPIDQIEAAMSEAWCNCCDEEFLHEEDGVEIELASYPAIVYSNCFGRQSPDPIPLADMIHGMEIGKPGVEDRRWSLVRLPVENYSPNSYVKASGLISCEGTIIYTGDDMFYPYWGAHVHCSSCDNYCEAAIARAEARIADWGSCDWIIRISTTFADCCTPNE